MPIHRSGSGWQWGEHGKVYPTRAGAEAQARAAYANGYAGDSIASAAGIAFTTPEGRVLFIRRSDDGDHAGEWCIPGGTTEQGELPHQTARREALEEVGRHPVASLLPLARETSDEGIDFTTFRQHVDNAFRPTLNHEHTSHMWAHPEMAPSPLHPALKKSLRSLSIRRTAGMAADEGSMFRTMIEQEGLAFDRMTVRRIDENGFLHVEMANISKACVNPYIGREIPNCKELGLDPEKIYQLLRDPKELEMGAPTFNNLPLLSVHIAVSAEDPQKEVVVGSTGTDASFEMPYLRNSLVVWDAEAIGGIESKKQREISCAYRYKPVMTPGVYEGMPYDGVMTNIRGNHVCLVREGRAGSDVIVGDSKLQEYTTMSKMALSKRAVLAKVALMGFLPAALATDAKPDLGKILVLDQKSNKWKDQKATIIKALAPLLAQDADVAKLGNLMDHLDGEKPMQGEMGMVAKDDDDVDSGGGGGDGGQESISIDDLIAMLQKMKGGGAMTGDDPNAFAGMPKTGGGMVTDPNAAGAPAAKKPVTMEAMDAAIKSAVADAVKLAREGTIASMGEVAKAEDEVRPYVGKIAVACDSADAVYKAALELMGIDTKDVHASAYKHILRAQPKPELFSGQKSGLRLASDSAKVDDDFAKDFPDFDRIKVA